MADSFYMTTANTLEGFAIVEQLGIVFGETVFKHSILDNISAGISNTVDSLRFRATEMSGSMNLIGKARDYAYGKLVEEAKKKGANAVIAIESDNTIGNNIMYISLYGTAVKVVPISEKEEYERNREKLEAERKQKVEEAKDRILENLRETTGKEHFSDEELFFANAEECTSLADVWDVWKGYPSLASKYSDVDQYLSLQMDTEKKYGGVNVGTIICDMKGWILKK